jgi:muramidase (phage lysozyme)
VTPNLSAFVLGVIPACEGTSPDDGWRALYGWRPGRVDRLFASFDDHPRVKFWPNGNPVPPGVKPAPYSYTTAAGKFQITESTWNDFIRAKGPHRFDEEGQTLCARWLIDRNHATADVEAGRLRAAISKCHGTWASLPGSTSGQPQRDIAYCERVFASHGGVQIDGNTTYHTPPVVVPTGTAPAAQPTPTTEPRMPIALPLLASILPAVFKLFEPRAQAAIAQATGADPNVAAQFLTDFAGKLGAAVGVPVTDDASAIKAVAQITSQPDAVTVRALQDQALDYLDRLAAVLKQASELDAVKWSAEVSGKDAAAARAKGERWDMTPYLVGFAGIGVTLCSVTLLAAIVYQSVAKTIDPVLLGLAGPLLAITFAAWKAIFDYRFDGTKESSDQSKALVAAATKG